MMSSAAWRTDDASLVEVALSPALRDVLPIAQRQAAAMLAPALGSDFKRHVSPALVLVASAGMTLEESKAWQAAAAQTLRGIPADLLEMGAKVARETVDHPSKIVPTILKATKRYWDERKADAARLDTLAAIARGERRRMPWEAARFDPKDRCSPEEAAAVVAEVGLDLSADRAPPPAGERGPRRMPSDEDYLAMGVPAATIEAHRRDVAEKRATAAPPAPSSTDVPLGPMVAAGGACPFCGNEGVIEHKGVMVCDAIGCGAMWRPDPNFVVDVGQSAAA